MSAQPKHRCAALVPLDREECARRFAAHHFGRIALVRDGRPVVYPVNYAWAHDAIVFASEAGWAAEAVGTTVAFEIDRADNLDHDGWSVLAVGRLDPFIGPADRIPPVAPWCGVAVDTRWFRIEPTALSGRRIALVDGR